MMKEALLIEHTILSTMRDLTPPGYEFGWYFPFGYLEKFVDLDREILRGHLRSLRNRGYVRYGHGFSDDGLAAGAGYTLAPKAESLFASDDLNVFPDGDEA